MIAKYGEAKAEHLSVIYDGFNGVSAVRLCRDCIELGEYEYFERLAKSFAANT